MVRRAERKGWEAILVVLRDVLFKRGTVGIADNDYPALVLAELQNAALFVDACASGLGSFFVYLVSDVPAGASTW